MIMALLKIASFFSTAFVLIVVGSIPIRFLHSVSGCCNLYCTWKFDTPPSNVVGFVFLHSSSVLSPEQTGAGREGRKKENKSPRAMPATLHFYSQLSEPTALVRVYRPRHSKPIFEWCRPGLPRAVDDDEPANQPTNRPPINRSLLLLGRLCKATLTAAAAAY